MFPLFLLTEALKKTKIHLANDPWFWQDSKYREKRISVLTINRKRGFVTAAFASTSKINSGSSFPR